nr:porin [Enterococcus sp. MJM16]
MEKYVYAAMLSFCIFLKLTSVISLSFFLLLFGIVAGILAGRVFLFRKYDLFLPVFKADVLSDNGKILVLCASVFVYLLSLSFIAIGSWLYLI